MPRRSGPSALALAAAALLSTGVLLLAAAPARWWAPGEGRVFPASIDYENPSGTLRTLLLDGPLDTKGHPFFEATGPNGRACVADDRGVQRNSYHLTAAA
jgi:hypothetical protein